MEDPTGFVAPDDAATTGAAGAAVAVDLLVAPVVNSEIAFDNTEDIAELI